jgi:hypothetical protein
MTDIVGYIFGYGALAILQDPMVRGESHTRRVVKGYLRGFRRRWTAGMENCAPLNDGAYYVDAASGIRPDICVVALSIDESDGDVNGIAIPVTAAGLPAFDLRELHYNRIDVSGQFSCSLAYPIWAYKANTQARMDCMVGGEQRRAYVSHAYVTGVRQAFHDLGAKSWIEYQASTDPVPFPARDLVRVVQRKYVI